MRELSDLIERGEFDDILKRFPSLDDALASPQWTEIDEESQVKLYGFYSQREESSEYSPDDNPIISYRPNRHLDQIEALAGHIIGVEGTAIGNGASTLVYEKDGQVLGYVSFQYNSGNVCIEEVAVHPNHRRKGIMTDLLQEVEAANPGTDIILKVAESNHDAYQAFLGYGFKDTGMADGHYRMLSKD